MATAERLTLRGLATILSITGLLAWLGCNAPNPNVLTQHNDKYRTGAYLAETELTPDKVRNQGMHVRYWLAPAGADRTTFPDLPNAGFVDGGIETQLLYLRHAGFKNGTANGLFVATVHNKLYALDADTGAQIWVTDLMQLDPGACRIPKGVAATPVIDLGRQQIFVTFSTQYGGQDCGLFTGSEVSFFLASLNISDGGFVRFLRLNPSTAMHVRNPPPFNGQFHSLHPGLLLDHNSLFLAFGSNAELEGKGEGFRGWIMRFNADNLALQGVFCTSPDEVGAGVWQGGGGLAADASGNVYFLTGNGTADFQRHFNGRVFVQNNLFGDSFVKLAVSGRSLAPTAWAPEDAADLNAHDADLGAGGVVLIPDANLVVGGGKAGVMYTLDRSSMSRVQQFNASTNLYHPWLRADTWDGGPHLHGAPTYWRGDPNYGYLYVWGEKDVLRMYRFDIHAGKFEERLTRSSADPKTTHREVFFYKEGTIHALPDTMPGGMISLSADGNNPNTGIVWGILAVARCMPPSKPCHRKEDSDMDIFGPFPAAVYAFNAQDLKLLWNDDLRRWEPKPNAFSAVPHWAPPTIADGKVFVPSGSGMVVVYELCKPGMQCAGTSNPIRPEDPGCGECHHFGVHHQVLATFVRPLRDRFPNEAAVQAWPRNALREIAPPLGKNKNLVFKGDGVEIYEAREAPGEHAGFSWQLQGSAADLQEIAMTEAELQREQPRPLRIHISPGGTWKASDGSTAIARVEKTVPAPQPPGKNTDAPWIEFRIAGSSGAGILSRGGYAQSVHTFGGGPPTQPPKRRGEIARVPYRAHYWLYQ